MRKKLYQQSGFSLIELLISLTIFSVVVTIATGSLLVLIDSNAKAQSIQSIANEATFAMDSMAREIRTGYSFRCRTSPDTSSETTNCTGGGTYLSLTETGGSLTAGVGDLSGRIAYYFNPNYYGSGHGAIVRRLGNTEPWYPITSENVDIEHLYFFVSGVESLSKDGNTIQPRVSILIEGKSGNLIELETDFMLQTTVTQRLIDL